MIEATILILILITLGTLSEYKNRPKSYNPKVTYTFSEDYKVQTFRQYKTHYLTTKEWENKREVALKLANYKCTNCNKTRDLNVHHDYGYKLIPNEPQDCLRVLCVKCHHLLHEKYGYPQTLEEYYEFDTRGKSIWLKT